MLWSSNPSWKVLSSMQWLSALDYFLFLVVNAESGWNVARINGMIKMPYPSQWQCFWTSTRFLELWLIYEYFLCLPDHDSSAEDWWWQVDLRPSIQRTAWYPAQTRDRYCAKCSRATKGKSLTEFLENLFGLFKELYLTY